MNRYRPSLLLAVFFCVIAAATSWPRRKKTPPYWDKVTGVSKTTATLRAAPGLDDSRQGLQSDIQADYVRYVPWLPSQWRNSSLQRTESIVGFFADRSHDHRLSRGHPIFSTFRRMFKTDKPVTYPADPDQPVWDYTQGTEFRDPTMKEVGSWPLFFHARRRLYR